MIDLQLLRDGTTLHSFRFNSAAGQNAAASARAPSPRFDIGKPSRTVACAEEEPGMPIITEVKVSEVGMTATRPMSIPRAEVVSMPKMNGSTSERPAMPPRPGKMPTESPSSTP